MHTPGASSYFPCRFFREGGGGGQIRRVPPAGRQRLPRRGHVRPAAGRSPLCTHPRDPRPGCFSRSAGSPRTAPPVPPSFSRPGSSGERPRSWPASRLAPCPTARCRDGTERQPGRRRCHPSSTGTSSSSIAASAPKPALASSRVISFSIGIDRVGAWFSRRRVRTLLRRSVSSQNSRS